MSIEQKMDGNAVAATAIAMTLLAASVRAALDPATGIDFSHPNRIRYDNRSLLIDNKPIFLCSGAMHYFRCPRELGKDRLQKLKAGTADSWTHPWTFDITRLLHEGNNVLALLVKNEGGTGGLYGGAFLDPPGKSLTHLEVAPDTQPAAAPIDPAALRRFLTQYTLEFTLNGDDIRTVPWKFHLDADANAFISLNGHLLGRYWAIGPQHDFWLPECWLASGKNSITLCARPTKNVSPDELIKKAIVEPYLTDAP